MGEHGDETARPRRRSRAPRPAPDAPAEPATGAPPGNRGRGEDERGLRGLVGAGPTQVPVVAAMRARDASQPTAEDLAAAEAELVVVRRHYVPPGDLAGGPGAPRRPQGRGGSSRVRS